MFLLGWPRNFTKKPATLNLNPIKQGHLLNQELEFPVFDLIWKCYSCKIQSTINAQENKFLQDFIQLCSDKPGENTENLIWNQELSNVSNNSAPVRIEVVSYKRRYLQTGDLLLKIFNPVF